MAGSQIVKVRTVSSRGVKLLVVQGPPAARFDLMWAEPVKSQRNNFKERQPRFLVLFWGVFLVGKKVHSEKSLSFYKTL